MGFCFKMASLTGRLTKLNKVIRLNRRGCTNRPFYHIVVQKRKDTQDGNVIEQLGSYDPMPNENNEKLVALNFERIQYWIGQGATVSQPVGQLLGLSGFLPIHPMTVMESWKNRPRYREKEKSKTFAA